MKYISIVKYVLTAACLAFVISLCVSDKSSKAPIEDVERQVTSVLDTSGMLKSSNKMIKRLYGLTPDEYEGIILYAPDDGMAVEELLIVKLADADQQETVAAAMQSRIDAQLENFDGYGLEQCAMLDAHVMEIKGNYMMLVIHTDAQKARSAFLDSL